MMAKDTLRPDAPQVEFGFYLGFQVDIPKVSWHGTPPVQFLNIATKGNPTHPPLEVNIGYVLCISYLH